MNKDDFKREQLYQASMAIARVMLNKKIITESEYNQINTIMLEKYRPLLGGLITEKGGYHAQNP